MVETREELVDVTVDTDGGRRGYVSPKTKNNRWYHNSKLSLISMILPLIAAVWATHAPGSIGRTGSVRGIVKYDFGLGSQHLATTNLIGLHKNIFSI